MQNQSGVSNIGSYAAFYDLMTMVVVVRKLLTVFGPCMFPYFENQKLNE